MGNAGGRGSMPAPQEAPPFAMVRGSIFARPAKTRSQCARNFLAPKSLSNKHLSDDNKKSSLETISKTLAALPCKDPPEGDEFYAIKNPVGDGDADSQLQQLKKLTATNILVIEAFFARLRCTDGANPVLGQGELKLVDKPEHVRGDRIYVKSNIKTDQSIREKAKRITLLKQYPKYRIEHIRDACRFKCVVNSVYDAFCFLNLVANQSEWKIIKFDIEKYIEPKDFGWRFLGADLKMENGQLVELYVVFKQMDKAKKVPTRMELTELSNHDIYEQWRTKDLAHMDKEETKAFRADAAISRKVYNLAFFKTLNKTTFEDWCALFEGFETQEELGGAAWVKVAQKLYLRTLECRGNSHNFFLRQQSPGGQYRRLPSMHNLLVDSTYAWMDSSVTLQAIKEKIDLITPLPRSVQKITVENLDQMKQELAAASREVRENIVKNDQEMLDSLEALVNFYRFTNDVKQNKALSIVKTIIAEMEDMQAIEKVAYIATPKCINEILRKNSDYEIGHKIAAMSLIMNLASVIVLTRPEWSEVPRLGECPPPSPPPSPPNPTPWSASPRATSPAQRLFAPLPF
jgi:hypothetical protein